MCRWKWSAFTELDHWIWTVSVFILDNLYIWIQGIWLTRRPIWLPVGRSSFCAYFCQCSRRRWKEEPLHTELDPNLGSGQCQYLFDNSYTWTQGIWLTRRPIWLPLWHPGSSALLWHWVSWSTSDWKVHSLRLYSRPSQNQNAKTKGFQEC